MYLFIKKRDQNKLNVRSWASRGHWCCTATINTAANHNEQKYIEFFHSLKEYCDKAAILTPPPLPTHCSEADSPSALLSFQVDFVFPLHSQDHLHYLLETVCFTLFIQFPINFPSQPIPCFSLRPGALTRFFFSPLSLHYCCMFQKDRSGLQKSHDWFKNHGILRFF